MKKHKKLFALIVIVTLVLCGLIILITGEMSSEKRALKFAETIVLEADPYGSLKFTEICADAKLDDYIRENYIYPKIYLNYEPGNDISALDGINSEEFKGKKTLEDDGTLAKEVISGMFPPYESILYVNGGMTNPETFFPEYIETLGFLRRAKFLDKYLTEKIIWDALNENAVSYKKKVLGDGEEKSAYAKAYPSGYKFSFEIEKKEKGENKVTYHINLLNKDEVVAKGKIVMVKHGLKYYVSNASSNVGEFYTFFR